MKQIFPFFNLIILFIKAYSQSVVETTRNIFASPNPQGELFEVSLPNWTQNQRFIAASFITLTPGTLTTEIHHDKFLIHLLDQNGKEAFLKFWKENLIPAISKIGTVTS